MILNECLTPKKVVEKGIEGILAIWKKHKIGGVGTKRTVRLLESTKTSIGASENLAYAENELSMLLENYESKM